jgi:amidase
MALDPAGRSVTEIAAGVRAGDVHAVDVVNASLGRIAQRDSQVGAFERVRVQAALREAEQLTGRGDLAQLALAGVPVAVKDNLDVAGEPTRYGCRAVPDKPAAEDHEVVRRLRAAGAVIVGKTRVPELSAWATNENAFGMTRNPWDLSRVPGGSSGGSAAAVAAGMAPLALGTDGLGSIRIPAAACGLFGIKPGAGLVPSRVGANSWLGMIESGPLATTVADARTTLAVIAARPDLADPVVPGRLRVAVSVAPPMPGLRVGRAWRNAVAQAAVVLRAAGHAVVRADPPYGYLLAPAVVASWTAGVSADAQGLDRALLEPRTRGHFGVARVLRACGFLADGYRDAWRERLARFFADHDVLVTPTLSQSPPPVRAWNKRPWVANFWRDLNYAPYCAPFNPAGVPAAALPWGVTKEGLPCSIQLVGPSGAEARLLGLAEQLERLHPWRRHAPRFVPDQSIA